MKTRSTSGASSPGELTAITKAYDLIREMTRRVGKFPRDYRFLLGDRILRNVYGILDLLITAKFRHEKAPELAQANLSLERLRFQVRLAHDERLISTRQYEFVSRQVDELGRIIGGWRRHQR